MDDASSDTSNGKEEFRVSGEKLVGKIKEVIEEGNIRRIIIKKPTGETVMEIPLTIGVVAAVLVPVFVAIGAIAALAAEWVIIIERR